MNSRLRTPGLEGAGATALTRGMQNWEPRGLWVLFFVTSELSPSEIMGPASMFPL